LPALLDTAKVIASVPSIGRNSPDSDSSPANSNRSSTRAGACPVAARIPIAIGRSNRPDSLGRSAGARLTVMRRDGKSKRQFCSAARTRSRASLTSASGRPTRVNEGRPLARWTSTVTSGENIPDSARLRTTARVIVHQRRIGSDSTGLDPGGDMADPTLWCTKGRHLRQSASVRLGGPGRRAATGLRCCEPYSTSTH